MLKELFSAPHKFLGIWRTSNSRMNHYFFEIQTNSYRDPTCTSQNSCGLHNSQVDKTIILMKGKFITTLINDYQFVLLFKLRQLLPLSAVINVNQAKKMYKHD